MATDRTRILITLDGDRLDADALRAVAALSEGGEVEVTGLFVEDEDLLRAARLPVVAEVSVSTGEVTRLTPGRMEALLTNQSHRARRQFETTAQRLNFKYSFRIARGRTAETVARASISSDFVVIFRSLRASGLRARRGSDFRPIVEQHANLLFLNEPWASGNSVILLCESSLESCGRALSVARRIADAESIDLLVAVPKERADAGISQADRVIALDAWTEAAIAELCEREDARLLVVPPTLTLDWRTLLLNTIDRVPCSLLRLD